MKPKPVILPAATDTQRARAANTLNARRNATPWDQQTKDDAIARLKQILNQHTRKRS